MASPLNLNSVSSHPTWLLSLAALSGNVTITHQSFKLECGRHPPLLLFSYQPYLPSAGLCAFTAFYLRPLSLCPTPWLYPLPSIPTNHLLASAPHHSCLPFLWSCNSSASFAWLLLEGCSWNINFIVNVHHHHLPEVAHKTRLDTGVFAQFTPTFFHSPNLDLHQTKFGTGPLECAITVPLLSN